jgi:pyruvate dehydrogenase complex dehydrogenase (E1) component
LIFDVQWELEGSQDTQEHFSNLHHLDALSAYELSIWTPLGSGHAASGWNVYKLQKGVELLELVSEDNTDSNVSETLDPASLDLDVGQ